MGGGTGIHPSLLILSLRLGPPYLGAHILFKILPADVSHDPCGQCIPQHIDHGAETVPREPRGSVGAPYSQDCQETEMTPIHQASPSLVSGAFGAVDSHKEGRSG